MKRIREIEGAGDWTGAFQRAGAGERTALMLGKRIEGLDSTLMGRVDSDGGSLKWWEKRKELVFG